ncbi:hypothetical protein MKX01_036264 [Papaver californicum]|nr:hypothetical protein MKX01_036264 [Papaver californicum]
MTQLMFLSFVELLNACRFGVNGGEVLEYVVYARAYKAIAFMISGISCSFLLIHSYFYLDNDEIGVIFEDIGSLEWSSMHCKNWRWHVPPCKKNPEALCKRQLTIC